MKKFGYIHLRFRRRTLPQNLAIYLVAMPFLLSFFIDFLGVPSMLKYTLDVVWCLLLLHLLVRRKLVIRRTLLPFFLLILFWVIYTFIGFLLNYQSAFYYLWGLRNNFRFYVGFFTFAMLLDSEDADACLKMMDVMFWINAAVSIYQYFVLGYEQDYLGGIFGVERGCNACSIIFFAIVISRTVLNYMNGQEKMLACFSKCAATLFIAAFSELKVFFVFFVLIVGMSAVMTKFSARKVALILLLAGVFMVASTILTTVFGASSNISIQRIIQLVTAANYATENDLGRFTAIGILSRRILTDWPSRMFGMGLGNCDTSAFAICNTPFYTAHSAMHYTWFSSAMLFLETGFLGLGINLLFFFLIFIYAAKIRKSDQGNLLHCQIAMIMAAVCVALTFYNSSLRMDVAYIAYFSLSLPFMKKSRCNSGRRPELLA